MIPAPRRSGYPESIFAGIRTALYELPGCEKPSVSAVDATSRDVLLPGFDIEPDKKGGTTDTTCDDTKTGSIHFESEKGDDPGDKAGRKEEVSHAFEAQVLDFFGNGGCAASIDRHGVFPLRHESYEKDDHCTCAADDHRFSEGFYESFGPHFPTPFALRLPSSSGHDFYSICCC